jgi:hypothetical protein
MAEKIVPNLIASVFRDRRAPVTPEDFLVEMASDVLRDILIYGYHMAPDGREYFASDFWDDNG